MIEPIGLNDTFTLVNTILCIVLILLRLFYYRKNPKIDTLISHLDSYLRQSRSNDNMNNEQKS